MKKSQVRNKKITSSENKIYYVAAARKLYRAGKYTAEQLSRMKHENIRDALERKEEEFALETIKDACENLCGYCFDFRGSECSGCPIREQTGKRCYNLPGWDKMESAKTKAKFRSAHKAWCKKIGLDVYGKE